MRLEANHVSYTIGGKTVLKDLSLTFAEGRRTAVIGPNGAGKSTLLRLLAGLARPSNGRILLDGRDIHAFGRRELAQKLAVLPQGVTAPPDTTVRRLVGYGRFPYHSYFQAGSPRLDREAIDWAMQVTKVTELQARQVSSLSGGERQRAFLAMTLAQQPKILLLDEPTTYLDIAHQLEVMQIIERLNREYGMTIIMVLHDINHALQYADEAAVLAGRHIVCRGVPAKVISPELLADVFGVRADRFTDEKGRTVILPVDLVKSIK